MHAGSAAGFFADAFLLGSGRTYTLVLDGCALFTVHLMRQTGPRAVQHQSMPISMELEAAAAALAAQAGPDAHLRCAQVIALPALWRPVGTSHRVVISTSVADLDHIAGAARR